MLLTLARVRPSPPLATDALMVLGKSPKERVRPAPARSDGSHTRSASRGCTTCERDPNGRIKRDYAARHAFQRSHPCPATGKTTGACAGYVVDHIVPLKRGGSDSPENMQWQTVADAKATDRVE